MILYFVDPSKIDIQAAIDFSVYPSRYAPNPEFDTLLVDSMRKNGFFEELFLTFWINNDKRLILVQGIRRARAAIEAGIKLVPFVILEEKSLKDVRLWTLKEGVPSFGVKTP